MTPSSLGGLGQGVDLVEHEQPFIGSDCHIAFEKGCVITIEPSIYLPGWGGIHIEDVVLVDEGLKF
jgi:Xaa-Pro aminopeptidase/Xaa-Pro dipeptidase